MTRDIRTRISEAYETGRAFERHRISQQLQARLAELDRITAMGAEGRCTQLAAEVRRILANYEALG